MASRASLLSDPEFLLNLMDNLPAESDSDEDDFDGYLEADEVPAAQRREDRSTSIRRSSSVSSLQDPVLLEESPLNDRSPSPIRMQGAHASGSPLSPAHSTTMPSGSVQTPTQVGVIQVHVKN